MSKPVRVILADDHALVLEGLRKLLEAEAGLHVVATATDGERVIEAVARFQPDLVVMDIRMPYMDGLTCAREIKRMHPEIRVIILTAYTDGETIQSVLAADADGLAFKTDPPAQTIRAIRQVVAGQLVFPAAARKWLFGPQHTAGTSAALSPREMEVLSLIAKGLPNPEIAQLLHISINTVKFHLRNIYQVLGVNNRTEASNWYHERFKK